MLDVGAHFGRKTGLCSSFFPYKPQGACLSRANIPDLEGERLWSLFR